MLQLGHAEGSCERLRQQVVEGLANVIAQATALGDLRLTKIAYEALGRLLELADGAGPEGTEGNTDGTTRKKSR